jgi:EmrB/QacA subfamily drug resistance transporter
MSVATPPNSSAPAGGPAEESPGRGAAWLLAVCCVAQFMVILDLSIVNVALPSMQSGLGFTAPELLWVVDAYAITFAGFLMLGGRVADFFGQRKTFIAALGLFALASLAGGLAPDKATLIEARAFQGLAGAFMAACSLAVIISSFAPGPKLNRAIGAWAAMNGLGGSAGVLFGGIITQELTWRWVLLINPPIAAAAGAVAWAVVRERRREREGSFDVAGALTLTVGQIVLVYGVVEAGLSGWSTAAALGPILGGIALLVVFGVVEARLASVPLIPFGELTKPTRIANNIVLLFSASLFPLWFVSSLYLQQVLDLSPLRTGLIFLPMTLTIMAVASRTGRLVSRFGVRAVLGSGLTMLTAGMLLMAKIGPSGSGVVYVMIPGILTAAGIAMSIVPSTIAATQGAKEGQAGLASGLVNTSRQIGGGLGLAVLVTLATQHTTHLIGTGVAVPNALTDGFRLAYLIGAGLAAAAALVTFTAMPRPAPAPEAATAPGAAGETGAAAPGAPAGGAWRLAASVAAVLALFVALVVAFAGSHSPPIGAYTTGGTYRFVTEPSLHPPIVKNLHPAASGGAAGEYILTADFYNLNYPPMVGQSGPLMLDRSLQPVWFQPVPERVVAANLAVQRYEGRPVLAWWQGFITQSGSTESGEYVVVDQHYRTVARLKGKGGWVLTLHEFAIEGEDVWVTANRNVARDLSSYGGAYNGALIDSAVQEYNLKSGALLKTWDALDHIPLGDSYATVPTNGFPWDAYHVNSIDLTGGGTFLVSMRNTWAAYLVNAATGGIEWTLGGKHSSFKFGPKAAFQWQHDVREGPGGTVTMFDDHCCRLTGGGTRVPATAPSRGLVLKVDQSTRTAALLSQYNGGGEFESEFMGDARPTANGNLFVGWGSEPYFSEYSTQGKLLLEGKFPEPDLSYRATVEPWVGLPEYPPAGAARKTNGRTTVYASWNGATQVVSWRVQTESGNGQRARERAEGKVARRTAGAKSATAAAAVPSGLLGTTTATFVTAATAAKSGFETAIPVPAGDAYFYVEALDAAGRVIGISRQFSATVRR